MNDALKILFSGLFAVAACVNLISIWFDKKAPAAVAKVFLMPLLIGVVLTAAKAPAPFMIAGMACGFLGDVLLLWENRQPCFIGGLAAFLIGHICYCVGIAGATGSYNTLGWIMSMLIIVAAGSLMYFSLQSKLPRGMKPPVTLYVFALMAIMFFASQMLIYEPRLINLALFAGTVAFTASDYILARRQFLGDKEHLYFVVMLTYIAAQSAICIWTVLR